MEDIDATKDYYQALGLTSAATVEELKAAYVSLALLHHPDTSPAGQGVSKESEAEFLKIAEAWGVLSKPERKKQYDLLRAVHIARTTGFVPSASTYDVSTISDGFNTQKMNFHNHVQTQASSNWRDLQDKYKTEKWQNLTLDQKKADRSRPIKSARSSVMSFVVPMVFVGIAGYYINKHVKSLKKNET